MAVNSILVDINLYNWIKCLSFTSGLTILLAGRVLIKIYPFSFKEFMSVYSFKNDEDKYHKFLKYSGMSMSG